MGPLLVRGRVRGKPYALTQTSTSSAAWSSSLIAKDSQSRFRNLISPIGGKVSTWNQNTALAPFTQHFISTNETWANANAKCLLPLTDATASVESLWDVASSERKRMQPNGKNTPDIISKPKTQLVMDISEFDSKPDTAIILQPLI